MFSPKVVGDREWVVGWAMAFAMAAFTAVVTAGANAVGEEMKARWKAQREKNVTP